MDLEEEQINYEKKDIIIIVNYLLKHIKIMILYLKIQ